MVTTATTRTVRRLRTGGALLLALLVGGACQDVSVTSLGVASVEVTPAEVTLVVGEGRIFEAAPLGEDGTTVTGRPVEWSVTDGDVAVVDGRGLLIAVGPGATVVEARVDGVVGEAAVRVLPRGGSGNGGDGGGGGEDPEDDEPGDGGDDEGEEEEDDEDGDDEHGDEEEDDGDEDEEGEDEDENGEDEDGEGDDEDEEDEEDEHEDEDEDEEPDDGNGDGR